MSEMIELMETTEPRLAVDTAGETRGSLVFQDTIRRDMGEVRDYSPYQFRPLYLCTHDVMTS